MLASLNKKVIQTEILNLYSVPMLGLAQWASLACCKVIELEIEPRKRICVFGSARQKVKNYSLTLLSIYIF